MFSLPNIIELNARAAAREAKQEVDDALANPGRNNCEVCDWSGVERAADHSYAWFDIFSNNAKGVIALCDQHDGTTGDPLEGYFECAECNRIFIENFSWELYYTWSEDHGQLCLPCALKLYLANVDNWIDPRGVREVRLETATEAHAAPTLFDRQTGILNLAYAQHLIGVEMPVPDALDFKGNVEFDSYTGCELSGTMSTYGAGHGESSFLSKVQALADAGHSRIIVILDAGYQFSISVGIYVDAAELRTANAAAVCGELASLEGVAA